MPQGTTRPTRPKRRVRLIFDTDKAAEIADRHGANTDADRARFFGVSQTAWSRLSRGHRGPGPDVIAAVLSSHPDEPDVCFDNLFRVQTEVAA